MSRSGAQTSLLRSASARFQLGVRIQRQGALIALLALVAFGAARYGQNFYGGSNLRDLLGDNAKYGFIALGMTFVIMSGGIDLSVGSVVALGGVLATQQSGHGLLAGLAVGIGAGAAVGLVNGLLIAKGHLQPFIVTLATLLSVRGLALQLAHTQAVVASPDSDFQKLATWNFLTLPVAGWLLFAAFGIGALALHYTPW